MKLILPLCTLHNIWILNYWNSLWSTWSSLDWPTMLSVYNITTFSGVFPLKAYSMAFNWQKKLKGKIWVEIGGIENLNSEDQIQQMKWSVNGPKHLETSWWNVVNNLFCLSYPQILSCWRLELFFLIFLTQWRCGEHMPREKAEISSPSPQETSAVSQN